MKKKIVKMGTKGGTVKNTVISPKSKTLKVRLHGISESQDIWIKATCEYMVTTHPPHPCMGTHTNMTFRGLGRRLRH